MHKPKLLGPDIIRWGMGLPREGVGAKKFGMSLEAREIKFLLAGYPEILPGYPGMPEKFEKKTFVFNSRSLIKMPLNLISQGFCSEALLNTPKLNFKKVFGMLWGCLERGFLVKRLHFQAGNEGGLASSRTRSALQKYYFRGGLERGLFQDQAFEEAKDQVFDCSSSRTSFYKPQKIGGGLERGRSQGQFFVTKTSFSRWP